MKKEILPCPFCGGEATIVKDVFCDNELTYVVCQNCGANTGDCGDSEDEAVRKWNTRDGWYPGRPVEEGWFLVKYRWTGGGDVTRTMIYRALEMKMSDYDGRLYADQEPTSEYWELYEWKKIEDRK